MWILSLNTTNSCRSSSRSCVITAAAACVVVSGQPCQSCPPPPPTFPPNLKTKREKSVNCDQSVFKSDLSVPIRCNIPPPPPQPRKKGVAEDFLRAFFL